MKRTLAKRLLQMIIVLFGISFFTFCLTYLAPGDPVRTMYAASGTMPSEEIIEATRDEMGLNDPFLMQYARWLGNCLKGDFGTSYSMNQPVLSIIGEKIVPTLKLAFLSLLIMLAVAVPFGVIAAVKQNRPIDYLIRGCTFLGVSIPNFWVGLLLLYLFALKLGLLPVVSTGNGISTCHHFSICDVSKVYSTGPHCSFRRIKPRLCSGCQGTWNRRKDNSLAARFSQCIATSCDSFRIVPREFIGRNCCC